MNQWRSAYRTIFSVGFRPRAISSGDSYSTKVLALSPDAFWKLDESSGSSVADYSGNDYEAQAIGVTWTAGAGPDGDSAAFVDGINDYIDLLADGTGAENNFESGSWDGFEGSFVMWAKVAGSGVWVDNNNRTLININSTGTDGGRMRARKDATGGRFRFNGAGITSVNVNGLSTTAWFPITITWSSDASRIRYYFNDQAVVENEDYVDDARFGDELGKLKLGAISAGTDHFYGYIADVQFYGRELSASDISLVMTR